MKERKRKGRDESRKKGTDKQMSDREKEGRVRWREGKEGGKVCRCADGGRDEGE